MYKISIILSLLVINANCQVLKFGSCPQVKLQQNFDPLKYFSGKFYEQKRFWAIFEVGSKCVNAEYTVLADGKVQVNNSAVPESGDGGRFFQIGEAYCDKNQSSACFVRFYSSAPYGSYNLLAADPNKYGLVFSCIQLIPRIANLQFAWILTRDKVVSKADMKSYLSVFTSNGIDVKTFLDTVQDCSDN